MFITLNFIDVTGTIAGVVPSRVAVSNISYYRPSYDEKGKEVPGESAISLVSGGSLFVAHTVEEIDRIIKQAEQSNFN